MTAAVVLTPDGDLYEVNLVPGKDGLALMREHLACQRVDCVALTDKLDMWIDDEGLYNHPVNPWATALAKHHGFVWQPYHGPVLLCGVDADGNSIDLTEPQVVGLLTTLADVTETA